jgi:hypothetical protein
MDEMAPLMGQLRELSFNSPWTWGGIVGWMQRKGYDPDAAVLLLQEVKAGRVTWRQVGTDKPDEGNFFLDTVKRLPSKLMWVLNVSDAMDFGEKVPVDAADGHTLFYRVGIIQPLGEELIKNIGDDSPRRRETWTRTIS